MIRNVLFPTCGLLLVSFAAACVGPLDRCSEYRDLEAFVTGSVTGRVTLTESRDTYDQFTWILFFTPMDPTDQSVTAIHLHEDGMGPTERVLYTFPPQVEQADPNFPDLRISTFEESRYSGIVPFDELFGLVRTGRTHIDVHTVAHPEGVRGQVEVAQFTDWTEVCDY